MPGLCFMFYFCLPLIFVWMALPGGLSRGGVVCSNTCERIHLCPAFSGKVIFGRGFLLHGGRVYEHFFFFPTHTTVVPCWLVSVLKSHGKGDFCQCLFIAHSNMTFWWPFTGSCHVSIQFFLPAMGSLFPELKLLYLKMQEVSCT